MNDSRTYNAANRDNATLLYATESLLRLAKQHQVAVLYLSVFVGKDPACDDLYRDLCQIYHVPLLSYRRAVLPELASKATASVFYLVALEHVHPPFQSHVLIAQYIASFLTKFHLFFLESGGGGGNLTPLSSPSSSSSFAMPPAPLYLPTRSHSPLHTNTTDKADTDEDSLDCFPHWTEFSLLGHDNHPSSSSSSSSSSNKPRAMLGWEVKADLPGKPVGWISDSSNISHSLPPQRGRVKAPTLSFIIKTVEGKVTVTYLETYRNAGVIKLYIQTLGHSQGHFQRTRKDKALAHPDMIPCCQGLKTMSATIDTLNEATHSSGIASKTLHFDISGTMELVVEHVDVGGAERVRRGGEKVKLFAVSSC
jgi:hypothetical protein